MAIDYDARVAALRKLEKLGPPDSGKGVKSLQESEWYSKALCNATGLSRAATANAIGTSTSQLYNYLSGRTPLPYPEQYALENLVVESKEQTCTPDSNPKPKK